MALPGFLSLKEQMRSPGRAGPSLLALPRGSKLAAAVDIHVRSREPARIELGL